MRSQASETETLPAGAKPTWAQALKQVRPGRFQHCKDYA